MPLGGPACWPPALAAIKLHLSELPEVEKPTSDDLAGTIAVQLGGILLFEDTVSGSVHTPIG